MTPRIHTSGNHAKPMSSARRYQVHGKLVGMDRPEGEPSLWVGALVIPGLFVLLAFVAAVVR